MMDYLKKDGSTTTLHSCAAIFCVIASRYLLKLLRSSSYINVRAELNLYYVTLITGRNAHKSLK